MDALLTALSNDPAARPTAARFRDQLAQLPMQSISRRSFAGAAGETGAVFPRNEAAGPAPSTISTSDSVSTALAADSQRAPGQAGCTPPQMRRKQAVRIAAVATLVMAMIAASMAWLISEPALWRAPAALTQRAIPRHRVPDKTGPRSTEEHVIQVQKLALSAKPFETVRVKGTYRGGSNTILRLQCREEEGWLAFPLPTRTDRSGKFTAYVELGHPGRYRLRLFDPHTGVMSKALVLDIKG